MGRNTRLNRFPAEMIAVIGTHLDRGDVLSLRSVCRHFNLALDNLFLKTFFRERTHLFSPYALEVLHAISKEGRFAREIGEIHFVALSITEGQRNGMILNLKNSKEECGMTHRVLLHSSKLLLQIFRNIGRVSRPMSLTLTADASKPIYGWNSLVRKFHVQFGRNARYSKRRVRRDVLINVLLKSCARASISVTSLHLSFDKFTHGPTNVTYHGRPAQNIDLYLSPVTKLKSLKIELDAAVAWYATRKDWRILSDLLRTAEHLQILSLACFTPGFEKRIPPKLKLARLCSLMHGLRLHESELANARVSLDELKHFIRTFSDTLHDLTLSVVMLDTNEKWDKVIDSLAELPHLDTLELRQLMTRLTSLDQYYLNSETRWLSYEVEVNMVRLRGNTLSVDTGIRKSLEALADQLRAFTVNER